MKEDERMVRSAQVIRRVILPIFLTASFVCVLKLLTGGWQPPPPGVSGTGTPSLAEIPGPKLPEPGAAPAEGRAVSESDRAPGSFSALHRVDSADKVRDLIAFLTDPALSAGERSARWRQEIGRLLALGAAALPGIREYLARAEDLHMEPGTLVRDGSIRTGFLEVLQAIGGPEAQSIMLEVLRQTMVPIEIARIARYLQMQRPGEFRNEIGTAIQETFSHAARGELHGWDLGPLFHVLQTLGDEQAAQDLERSAGRWHYYAVIALAEMPSGQGVESLVRLAKQGPVGGTAGLAMEALAQAAGASDEAGAALLELARSRNFSERSWARITAGLAGERYFIQHTDVQGAPVALGQNAKLFHLAASGQKYYSAPVPGGMSTEQLMHRVSIIDHLLGVGLNESVINDLQQARTMLVARMSSQSLE
jgi:hypothetical protein